MALDLLDAVYGSLVGAAIGDALGAPVEGWSYWQIWEKYGRLEDLVSGAGGNTNRLAGGVTGDTALRQYVALAVVRKEGRIMPDDLAALWLEKGNSALFRGNERVVYEKLSWGTNPWDSGRGGGLAGTATMAIAPVGIVNAGNLAQAYQDGYTLASVIQDGEERHAAASLAAGIAQAIMPGATLVDVETAMSQYSSDLMQRALELTLDLAKSSGSIALFTQAYYEQMADWRMAQPPHQIQPVPAGYPGRAKYGSHSSLERIPVALALLHLCGGDVNDGIIEGANFGRDSNAIASIVGCIAGALQGATRIRSAWIDTCEAANGDLYEALEDDPAANFYSMSWRLARTLKAERQATESRLKTLDRLLGR